MHAILVVDLGNTSTSVALAAGKRVFRVRRNPSRRVSAAEVREALAHVTEGHDVVGAVLCSVVPRATAVWQRELQRVAGVPPLQVTHRLELGLSIDYPRPAQIGQDRLANACAAVSLFGAPVVVADFGTALTFDVVSPACSYVGGVIAPGLPLMTEYLAEKTALLPRIRLRRSRHRIGRSTVEAMQLGARLGYRGIVREIFDHVRSTLGVRRIALCATGGYARWALADTDIDVHIVPDLTLRGLARIYELNRGG